MTATIISAFPCCGKSYLVKNNNTGKRLLDLESSYFSWMMSHGSKIRNPDFPNNYMDEINKHIDEYDYIFVSSHISVRTALHDHHIPYILVYPENTPDCYQAWKARCYDRGTKTLWDTILSLNWNSLLHSCLLDNFAKKHIRLNSNMYISNIVEN